MTQKTKVSSTTPLTQPEPNEIGVVKIMPAEEQAKIPVIPKRTMMKIPFELMVKTKQFLEKRNMPYYAERCNENVVFKSNIGYYKNKESEFDPKELWFIAAVKSAIIGNGLHHALDEKYLFHGTSKDINYYQYNSKLKEGDVITGAREIDLSAAYFETLNIMYLIPEVLYNRCMNPEPPHKPISKKVRLAAVGSLDKKTRIDYFDGYKQHYLGTKRQTETGFLWNVIANHVGKLMVKAAQECGEVFILFWVDAIFIHGKNTKKVERIFSEAGYKFSSSPVKKITVKNNNIVVDGKKVNRKNSITGEEYVTTLREFPFNQSISPTQIMKIAGNQY